MPNIPWSGVRYVVIEQDADRRHIAHIAAPAWMSQCPLMGVEGKRFLCNYEYNNNSYEDPPALLYYDAVPDDYQLCRKCRQALERIRPFFEED